MMKPNREWIDDWRVGVKPSREDQIATDLLDFFLDFWVVEKLDKKSKTTMNRDSMIQSFKNQAIEDLFNGLATKAALKLIPRNLWNILSRKLDQLDSVASLNELRVPPGNHLEALKRDRKGQHSIRINDQYRVCFKWTESGPSEVEVADYH